MSLPPDGGRNGFVPGRLEPLARAGRPAPAETRPSPVQDRLAALLDGAHEALPADELAALLVSVGRLTGPPDGLLRPGAPALSPAARAAHLDPVVRALAAAPGAPDGLGAWLRDYLDELAARPRGSALWQAA